jgi:TonB family protein
MLRTLLESRPTTARNHMGTAASATIHLLLIATAAFVTTATAAVEEEDEPGRTIIRWGTPRAPSPVPVVPAPSTPSGSRSTTLTIPSISLTIATTIPDVNVPLGVVRSDDFVLSPTGSEEAAGDAAVGTSLPSKTAYDAYEVDKAVTALSGAAPAYPVAMRSAGIEGEVKAQFIVNVDGRAELASIRIVSSTNDAFSRAVSDALPRMRFIPARLRGKAVPQTVQQLFAFRLSR